MKESGTPPSPRKISARQPTFKKLLVILVLIFLGVAALIALYSEPEFVWSRIMWVGIAIALLGLALFDNWFEANRKEQVWTELANKTGLTCQVHGFILVGYSVEVSGVYRGHKLALSTFKQGKGQVPSTEIEMQVDNEAGASLRLRGPFNKTDAKQDVVVKELFQTTDAHEFGSEQRFFIRSKPIHLVTNIFGDKPLYKNLLELPEMVNIELQENKLRFDQLGILQNVDYLIFLFNLLTGLAQIIEHGSYTKLTGLSNKE